MVISMQRWQGKLAIVTGASSGIGVGIVTSLINEGVHVVGLARRKETMDELSKNLEGKKGKFHPLKADLTKEEEILEAFNWVKVNLGPIHILINNAGIIKKTNLIEGDTNMWKEILDTNTLAYCITTREAIKDMRANNVDGHIIHINSIGAYKVPNFPYLSVYSASKYAVKALTETLRQELNSIGSKIRITSVSPGTVLTEIMSTAGIFTKSELQTIFKDRWVLTAEDVGDAVLYVLATPPHVQVHELIIKANGED